MEKKVKILIHDYAGHPFQFELSKELSNNNSHVIHAFYANDPGPKGDFYNDHNLNFIPVGKNIASSKKNLIKRQLGDILYGVELYKLIKTEKPDIVLSGNTPTISQHFALLATKQIKSSFIFWSQDIYHLGLKKIINKKYLGIGFLIYLFYLLVDVYQYRRSDQIIVIGDFFKKYIEGLGITKNKINIIQNWGHVPLSKIKNYSKSKAKDEFNFIYTGTMGAKHCPEYIGNLAKAINGMALIDIYASGSGLVELKNNFGNQDNLNINPLIPDHAFAKVLRNSSCALVSIKSKSLEYSIPSKVLNYIAAELPILLITDKPNFLSNFIIENKIGIVIFEYENFHNKSVEMINNNEIRKVFSNASRLYSLENFNINKKSKEFLKVFSKLTK